MSHDLNSASESTAEVVTTSGYSDRPTKPKKKRRFRRMVIALILGGILVAVIQSLATLTDHQFANFASAAVTLVTLLFVAYQIHRLALQRGFRLLVPGIGVGLLAITPLLFKFDGFSGEMVPLFKYRFASPAPEVRQLENSLGAASEAAPNDISSNPSARALTNSLGFLGNDRTAVIAQRQFDVPSSDGPLPTLWSQGIGAGWSSFSVVEDRAITLEQREGLECLTCYQLIDGKLLWLISHQALHQNPLGSIGPRSTPTIHGDFVYAQGATGRVWCVNWRNGETRWTVDLLELAGWDQAASEAAITWGRAGSPLCVDELCVVPYGGPDANQATGRSLIALDQQSGEPRWIAGADQISYASPALLTLAGVRQIVSVNEATITGHRVDDGGKLWEFPWIGQSNAGANCSMVVPAGENRFLIGKGYGGGSALVEVTTDQSGTLSAFDVWRSSEVLKTKFTHACVLGNTAFGISNGSLEAVSLSDGEQRWRQSRSARFGQGQLMLVGDTLIAQAEKGEIVFVAADPDAYRESARIPALESKTWNVPTIAGRHLLVRNDRQAICFFLPERKP